MNDLISKQELCDHIKLYLDRNYLGETSARTELSIGVIASIIHYMPVTDRKDEERWIPVNEELPKEDGDYLCTIEWYGTSTKELLVKNGYKIEIRLKLVHFLSSDKSFKECDEFCTYKVLAWKNQCLYKGE